MSQGGGGGGEKAPIIVKKKKGGHGGHHGGAWKVAYADFVTAMMAFFLLLWLLNVTTSDQKTGISDYFAPASVSRESSGSGGALGGRSLTVKGALMSPSSPLSANVPGVGPPGFASQETENAEDSGEASKGGTQEAGQKGGETQKRPGENEAEFTARLEQLAEKLGIPGKRISERLEDFVRRLSESSPVYPRQRSDENRLDFQRRMENVAKDINLPGQKPGESLAEFASRVSEAGQQIMKGQEEAKQFQETASTIRQAIQSVPELKELAQNLVLDQTPEGLRIQIVDQERTIMFPPGSSQMFPQARELMSMVARAVGRLPNKVSISGHTDSTPFTRGGGRDNWDLSTERANASRRALIAAGIDESRIETVVGRADRDLLVPNEPSSPRNRRISIILLREAKQPGGKSG